LVYTGLDGKRSVTLAGWVPGTGHGLLSDKPDLCAAIITDFLG
jgi:pimeloyl-ACP methyl ester carboxylesterase